MSLTPRPWRREGCLLLHPELNLTIADFFPDELPGAMVHPDTHSAQEHAQFALKAVNSHERLIRERGSLLAEAKELLRNATYADGQATVLTQDCEALEAAIARAEGREPEHPDYAEGGQDTAS